MGDGRVGLVGGECRCGHVFFPFQQFGCERCGAFGDAIEERLLEGVGQLSSQVEVVMPSPAGLPPPYRIGTVHLARGGVVRALLGGSVPAPAPVAAFVEADEEGAKYPLRFQVQGEGA